MNFNINNGRLRSYHNTSGATSITIPDTVQTIGSWALGKQDQLVSIRIPASVEDIGYHSFYECPNLKSIQVSEVNPFFSDIDGVLYDKKQSILLHCPNGLEKIHIPASVVSMKKTDSFAGCHLLKEITVDKHNRKYTVLNGVLYEHNGFILTKLIRCPVHIRKLKIPKSVKAICHHAFEYCTELEEITIPKRVTEIEDYTFKDCHNLKQVHLHSRITVIRQSAFRYCKSLKEIILPSGVKEVSANAFDGCESLEKLVIPETVESVGYIVGNCPALKSVTCHGINLPMKHSGEINGIIWMIARKDIEEKITPAVKYPVLWQMFIRNRDDLKMEQYIRKHLHEIITELILDNQIEMTQNYLNYFRELLTTQNIDEFIRLAIDNQKYEIQIFLTNMKYKRNDFAPKDWSL